MTVDGLRVTRLAILCGVVAVVTSACTSNAPGGEPKQATFSYTCCEAADIDRAWHPGEVMTLRWKVQKGTATSAAKPSPINLSATLTSRGAAAATVRPPRGNGKPSAATRPLSISAAPVVTTDWAGGTPTSRLQIPVGAVPGLYDLSTRVQSGGFVTSRALTVRIAARGRP